MNPSLRRWKRPVIFGMMLLGIAFSQTGWSSGPGGDRTGVALRESFIWSSNQPDKPEFLQAAFRRSFDVGERPAQAALHVFAYTRYRLYVNGEYIGRGPNRFENIRPEYDTWDITSRLRPGKNVIAVLASRDWPRGTAKAADCLARMRRHAPGFTALLAMQDSSGRETSLRTDESWLAIPESGFSQPEGYLYSSIAEIYDARALAGDWWVADFDDRRWPAAVRVDTQDVAEWPALSPRSIPLLREASIPFEKSAGASPEEFVVRVPRIVQAYWTLDIDAEEGSRVTVTPLLPEGKTGTPSTYTCRAGRQRWMGGDTFAFDALSVRVDSGRADIGGIGVVEVLYPFERVGSFTCSDPLLNRIWELTARSLEVLSEDAYTDCGDRERSEWMDCDPPMYDATRVMMAGPDGKGGKVWGDPRLFANMLRRVAYTQEPDGMLRARTCSDLIDIHTRMEDRACDWVDGLRKYYEATGDKDLIRELWPFAERLLDWFAARRTENGLVKAREWIAWDNPMSYAECEGAANNAFIWRAFSDAAWLAAQTGNQKSAEKWSRAADQLSAAFQTALWDEAVGAYCSSIGTPEILPENRRFRQSITLKSENGRTEPTLHANLFALDRGIVPADRRARTTEWALKHSNQIRQIMANYYFFKILYALDTPSYDQEILDRIRKGWKAMAESPWGTTWESPNGGSKMHCYGIVPGPILSSYVLGVRRDRPVWEKKLIVEPHLADLEFAKGTVVTEFGPVPVSWQKKGDRLAFEVTVPEDVEATLALPIHSQAGTIELDGVAVPFKKINDRATVSLPPGVHRGVF